MRCHSTRSGPAPVRSSLGPSSAPSLPPSLLQGKESVSHTNHYCTEKKNGDRSSQEGTAQTETTPVSHPLLPSAPDMTRNSDWSASYAGLEVLGSDLLVQRVSSGLGSSYNSSHSHPFLIPGTRSKPACHSTGPIENKARLSHGRFRFRFRGLEAETTPHSPSHPHPRLTPRHP